MYVQAPARWLLGRSVSRNRAPACLSFMSQAGLSRSYHCLYDEMLVEVNSVQGMHVLGHERTAMYVINLYVS